MNKAKKVIFILFLIAVLAVVTGCTIRIGTASKEKGADGGVWKSVDGGVTWTHKTKISTVSGKAVTISGVDVRHFVPDPQDINTFYLVTSRHGVIYTNDGGEIWQQFKEFKSGRIESFAVDPKLKCNLYITKDNKLFKSDDCGRFWTNIYYHQKTNTVLTDVIIDHYNSSVVYLSTSDGEVIKSLNGGATWTTIYKAKGKLVDLEMDPHDSRVIYAATRKKGLYKTLDSGMSWVAMGEGLKSYSGSHYYKDLIIGTDVLHPLILISEFGMLRSFDNGDSWEVVKLLPAKTTAIYSVALNPQNSKEIYYTTGTTLVKSTDGGETWSSHKLPLNSRVANQIIINPKEPKIIYLGTMSLEK